MFPAGFTCFGKGIVRPSNIFKIDHINAHAEMWEGGRQMKVMEKKERKRKEYFESNAKHDVVIITNLRVIN